MKISLKLDPDTLSIAHKIVCDECYRYRNSRFGKSIRAELWEVLSKKCIAYINNPNGKPITISLRYHLAIVLQDCTADFLLRNPRFGTYEYNKIIMLKNELHQKLL